MSTGYLWFGSTSDGPLGAMGSPDLAPGVAWAMEMVDLAHAQYANGDLNGCADLYNADPDPWLGTNTTGNSGIRNAGAALFAMTTPGAVASIIPRALPRAPDVLNDTLVITHASVLTTQVWIPIGGPAEANMVLVAYNTQALSLFSSLPGLASPAEEDDYNVDQFLSSSAMKGFYQGMALLHEMAHLYNGASVRYGGSVYSMFGRSTLTHGQDAQSVTRFQDQIFYNCGAPYLRTLGGPF